MLETMLFSPILFLNIYFFLAFLLFLSYGGLKEYLWIIVSLVMWMWILCWQSSFDSWNNLLFEMPLCHSKCWLRSPPSISGRESFNQDLHFKKIVKYVGQPLTHLESIASSMVIIFNFSPLYFLLVPCAWNGESAKIRLLSCELWHSGHVFWLQYQQMLTG